MNITIEIENTAVLAAFNRLIQTGQDMGPIMRIIGEDVVDRAKKRNEWGGSEYERGDGLTVAAFLFTERKAAPYRGLTLLCQVVPNSAQNCVGRDDVRGGRLDSAGRNMAIASLSSAKCDWVAELN